MIIKVKKGTTKKYIDKLLERTTRQKRSGGINAQKYCGVLTIDPDPLVIQKKLRNEWE